MISFSEIDTTVKRAARACGISWGISEEVGKNIRLLEMFGLPGVKNINAYLKIYKKNYFEEIKRFEKTSKPKKYFCPLMSGVNFMDQAVNISEFNELEIKQMTTPLSTDKERALVDEIGSLQNKIKEHDNLIETDTEVLEARDNFREAENTRRELGKKMQKSRQEAQSAHHSMKDSLRTNRQTRRKADAAQRLFVKAKEKADEVHNEYIEYLRGMQEIDRMTASQGRTGSSVDQKASAASAEDLFAKFLAGEKLTTEQLMVIQKAGML